MKPSTRPNVPNHLGRRPVTEPLGMGLEIIPARPRDHRAALAGKANLERFLQELRLCAVRVAPSFKKLVYEYGEYQIAFVIGNEGKQHIASLAGGGCNIRQFSCNSTPHSRRSGVHWLEARGQRLVLIRHGGSKIDSIYQRMDKLVSLSSAAHNVHPHLAFPSCVLIGVTGSWLLSEDRGENLLRQFDCGVMTGNAALEIICRIAYTAWQDRLLLLDIAPRNVLFRNGTMALCDLEWGGEPFQGTYIDYLFALLDKNGLEMLFFALIADGELDVPPLRVAVSLLKEEGVKRCERSLKEFISEDPSAMLHDPVSVRLTMFALKYWNNVSLQEKIVECLHTINRGQFPRARAIIEECIMIETRT